MRRHDKEISTRKAIDAVIEKARVCRLAMVDGDRPYLVPLCFGYRDNTLYFHSAAEGRKISALRENPAVCFEFETDVDVKRNDKPCKWGMKFKSVVGFGTVEFIDEPTDKQQALDIIMNQYGSTDRFDYQEAALDKTAVFRVTIESISGKQST